MALEVRRSGDHWTRASIGQLLLELFFGTDLVIGYGPLIREYVYFLLAKLAFHRQHPEFNGMMSWIKSSCILLVAYSDLGTFEYEEYISLKSINDPNEG
jgi:hypothetical protein